MLASLAAKPLLKCMGLATRHLCSLVKVSCLCCCLSICSSAACTRPYMTHKQLLNNGAALHMHVCSTYIKACRQNKSRMASCLLPSSTINCSPKCCANYLYSLSAGVQSYRADKAQAVDNLWSSLSLYLNHCATQAAAAAAAAAALPSTGSIPADSAPEVPDQADHDDTAEQADDGDTQTEAEPAAAAIPEAASDDAAGQDAAAGSEAAEVPAEQATTQVCLLFCAKDCNVMCVVKHFNRCSSG